ncbi:MAG: glycosyltransferase [Actinomycetota bacterium]|nr:glycosyltransferase [Actinomycetota bacterium]
MARFLFVVPPLHGHVNPTMAVGAALAHRGHDVAWCGAPTFLEGVLPAGAEVVASGEDVPAEAIAEVEARSHGLKGAPALKFFWEEFLVPLAHAMIPGVEAAITSWRPDVVVADQQTVAGALVARRHGVPWATSATTSAELVDPFAGFPKLQAWSDGCLVQVQLDHGVPAAEASAANLRFSDDLVLAFTTVELAGRRPYPSHWRFVGPAFGDRPPHDADFPWDHVDGDDPVVLVSLGTVNAAAGERFYRVVAEVAGGRPERFVLAAPPEVAGPMPANVVVRPRVPQLELIERAGAVVCHAGHNTVCEALASGVPLVVAPIRDDQPVVAAQVVEAGAGIRVRYVRVRPDELSGALDAVLTDPAYREAATAVGASFIAAGGAAAAAVHLEDLAGRR